MTSQINNIQFYYYHQGYSGTYRTCIPFGPLFFYVLLHMYNICSNVLPTIIRLN